MRDKNLNPEQFNIQLERILKRKLQSLVLTEAVFVNPNLQLEISIGPLPKKLLDLKALLIVSYFCKDRALGFFLREEIREKRIRQFSLQDKLSLEILLLGKKELICNYLFLSQEWTTRTFFGNILPRGIELFNNLRIVRRKLRKPTKPVWRRGYKDKGSRRPETQWLPSSDFSWTEIQNDRERIENQYQLYLRKVITLLENYNQDED